MAEVLRAIGIAAGILFPVVILVIVVSRATVLRGEDSMRGHDHPLHAGHTGDLVAAGPAGTAAATAKVVAAGPVEDPSVIDLLILGTILFTLAVAGLFLVSLLAHM
jgi:hypothetical protein